MRAKIDKFFRYFIPALPFTILVWLLVEYILNYFNIDYPLFIQNIITLPLIVVYALSPFIIILCGLLNILIEGNKKVSFLILIIGIIWTINWLDITFSMCLPSSRLIGYRNRITGKCYPESFGNDCQDFYFRLLYKEDETCITDEHKIEWVKKGYPRIKPFKHN